MMGMTVVNVYTPTTNLLCPAAVDRAMHEPLHGMEDLVLYRRVVTPVQF